MWVDCDWCGGEGYAGHDCGEDACCCLMPDDNVVCSYCEGHGGWEEIADEDRGPSHG